MMMDAEVSTDGTCSSYSMDSGSAFLISASRGVTTLICRESSTALTLVMVKFRFFINSHICSLRAENCCLTKVLKSSSLFACIEPPFLVPLLTSLADVYLFGCSEELLYKSSGISSDH